MAEDRRPSVVELRDRIDQLRAALREMPPHSGSGTRAALQEELLRLERLLADRH